MTRRAASIRLTLTLWYSTILVTTLVAFGLTAYTYSSQTLSENLDRSLQNEVKWVSASIRPKASKMKPSRKYAVKRPAQLPQAETPSGEPSSDERGDADDEIWTQIYEHAQIGRASCRERV